jgi:hypothetical protein
MGSEPWSWSRTQYVTHRYNYPGLMNTCDPATLSSDSSCSQRAHLVYGWVQDEGGTRAGIYGQYEGRRLCFSLGKYATVFQAEIYAILACAHKIKTHGIPEKYVSIRSDSQAAWKALTAVRTMSLLDQRHWMRFFSTCHGAVLGAWTCQSKR